METSVKNTRHNHNLKLTKEENVHYCWWKICSWNLQQENLKKIKSTIMIIKSAEKMANALKKSHPNLKKKKSDPKKISIFLN